MTFKYVSDLSNRGPLLNKACAKSFYTEFYINKEGEMVAKGITSVIAVILLLLITIAVIGFATGFFQTIVQTSGTQATDAAQQTGDRLQKTVEFVAASAETVTVKNAGTTTMTTATDLTVLIAGVPKTCTWSAASVAAGTTTTCTITATAGNDCTPSAAAITVVAPGNDDTSGKCP